MSKTPKLVNQDPFGHKQRIESVLSKIDQNTTPPNAKAIRSFARKIASYPSRKGNKIRTPAQQSKLLGDLYLLSQVGFDFEAIASDEKTYDDFEEAVRSKKDWSENTKNQRMRSIQQLIKITFGEQSWMKEKSPGKVGFNKPRESDLFTDSEMLSIIQESGSPRNKALFAALREGLRPGELIRLRYGDLLIDEAKGLAQINAHEAKTGARTVYTKRGYSYLRIWKQTHPNPKHDSILFPNNDGDYLTHERIGFLNRKMMKRAGIPPERSKRLYNWRKSSITDFLTKGGRIDHAAEFYGTSIVHIQATYNVVKKADLEATAGIVAGEKVKAVYFNPHVLCPRCSAENKKEATLCSACGWEMNKPIVSELMKGDIERMVFEALLNAGINPTEGTPSSQVAAALKKKGID